MRCICWKCGKVDIDTITAKVGKVTIECIGLWCAVNGNAARHIGHMCGIGSLIAAFALVIEKVGPADDTICVAF